MQEQELEGGTVLIGQRLVELRIKNQMTQEKLAEKLGVSRQAISKWESNRTFPNIDKLFCISELYQVSLDYLLRGRDYEPVQKETIEPEDIEECSVYSEGASEDAWEQSAYSKGEFENIEEQADVQSEQAEAESVLADVEHRRIGKKFMSIRLASVLIGMLFIVNCVIIGTLLVNQSWSEENETAAVYIDTIYEQYTKAKVVMFQEDGSYTEKVLWLDTEGVRENDWGFCYYNGQPANGIKVNYNLKTLLLPVLSAGILLILLFLLRLGGKMEM